MAKMSPRGNHHNNRAALSRSGPGRKTDLTKVSATYGRPTASTARSQVKIILSSINLAANVSAANTREQ
jgi:hypothetical protein